MNQTSLARRNRGVRARARRAAAAAFAAYDRAFTRHGQDAARQAASDAVAAFYRPRK